MQAFTLSTTFELDHELNQAMADLERLNAVHIKRQIELETKIISLRSRMPAETSQMACAEEERICPDWD